MTIDHIRSDLLLRALDKAKLWSRDRFDTPGLVLHTGPSMLNGATIHVVVTGLRTPSQNRKTGPMTQAYILPDVWPVDAVRTGADEAVCGDCKHRPARDGACYVQTGWGPSVVWKALQAGKYARVDAQRGAELLEGALLRIGAWGDPLAAPLALWDALVPRLGGFTGYTHQWRRGVGQAFLMASVDSPEERTEAKALGFPTFRVKEPGDPLLPGERMCFATAYGVPCAKCLGCAGTSGRFDTDFAIDYHGFRAKTADNRRQLKMFDLFGG